MRAKRSKKYKKALRQFELNFQFRPPFQVIVDTGMLQETILKKMDLTALLRRTIQGEIKPLITQCTVRHLYNLPQTSTSDSSTSQDPTAITSAQKTALLDVARSYETRKCMHAEALSDFDCIRSLLNPSGSGNKHRYIIAVQDENLRQYARSELPGIPAPAIYVKRSVMCMEPMSERVSTEKGRIEREKMKSGVKKIGVEKRKRENVEPEGEDQAEGAEQKVQKKKKAYGVKGPNPLSVKRKKSEPTTGGGTAERGDHLESGSTNVQGQKKKRVRRQNRNPGGAPNDDGMEPPALDAEATS